MKRAAAASIIILGFTAVSSQVVLLREFLVVFSGNELAIGFILASWLIGGAIGSALLGRRADGIRDKILTFSFCQIALAIILPLTILAVRELKTILGVTTGSIVPFFPFAVSSLATLLPVCAILGFLFSLGCGIYNLRPGVAAAGIGSVYFLESLGSIAGGLLTSLVLIKTLKPSEIFGLLALVNLAGAAFFLSTSSEKISRRIILAITLAAFFAILDMLILGGFKSFERYALSRLWAGHRVVDSRNSIYGNVTLTGTAEETSFFENGLHIYTVPDIQPSEEAAHFTLLEHPAPRSVLLIGGGLSGVAGEIMKHPVEKLDYVELDPLIIEMARTHLSPAYYAPLKNPKVSIKNTDGRSFVKLSYGRYDCVIIDIGDPSTAQMNRYYTKEFFEEAKRILNEGGVLSFSVTSSENYINKELGNFLKSIYMTLKSVFEDVKVIPGDRAYFIASGKEGYLTYDYRKLMERAGDRGLSLKYVREYYLKSKLSGERVSYTENALKRPVHINMNYDFTPISYYYYTIFWMTHFKGSLLRDALKWVTPERLKYAALILSLALILYGFMRIREERFLKEGTVFTVAISGFSLMVFQMVVLLSFQIICGYLYYKLGIIITAFMIGLALGSFTAAKAMPRLKKDVPVFILNTAGIFLYAAALPFILLWINGMKTTALSVTSDIIFPAIPVVAGFLGGFQFPLAGKIYMDEKAGPGRAGGFLYGADLSGACLGALLSGAVFIPLAGIVNTCIFTAGLNFMMAVLLLCGYTIRKRRL